MTKYIKFKKEDIDELRAILEEVLRILKKGIT